MIGAVRILWEIIKTGLLLVMIALALPTVLAVPYFWPMPHPPAMPDWQPTYQRLIAADDGVKADKLLRTAFSAMDPAALRLCVDAALVAACDVPSDMKTADLRSLADKLEAMRDAEAVDARTRPVRAALENLGLVEAHFEERQAAGLRFAFADSWLYGRCVQPYAKTASLSQAVVGALRDIEGGSAGPGAFERALARCTRCAADFARQLTIGSYGDSATAYIEEWERYASFLEGLGSAAPRDDE